MSDQFKSVKAVYEPINLVFGKPSEIKDYVKIFETYISKQLIFKVLMFIVVAGFAVKFILLPYLEGKLWIPTIVINTPKYHTYSGTAKVISEDGESIYKGNLESGIVTGFGELFEDNFLVYQGEFVNNTFYGSGKLFYPESSTVRYEGIFENNLYTDGKLYYENGNTMYEGAFGENNQYSNGILYDEDETIQYKGAFTEDGLYMEGILYYTTEQLKYEGTFDKGKYKEGSLYFEEGSLKYSGTFLDELYDGFGKLYDNGMLLYEGGFVKGDYSGTGTLYFSGGGQVAYKGGFLEGLYSGEGILYNRLGKELFQGNFYKGEINYSEFTDANIEYVREVFGKERQLIMLENSFLLVYEELSIIFELSFSDEENQPLVQKIKLLGQQNYLNVKKGMWIEEFRKAFSEEVFTEYYFYVDDETEISFSYADEAILEGDEVYSIKYNLESIYIRAFFHNEEGNVIYYEIGGI